MKEKLEKKVSTPIINPEIGLNIKTIVFISVPYVPCISEEFRRIFHYISVVVIPVQMHPKDKVPLHLKENSVYWFCCEKDCSQFYSGESSTCLENRVKEHSSHVNHHIRTNSPALNCNTGKIYMWKIFSRPLGLNKSSDGSGQIADLDYLDLSLICCLNRADM